MAEDTAATGSTVTNDGAIDTQEQHAEQAAHLPE